MDLLPPHFFVRGADARGALLELSAPITLYRYVSERIPWHTDLIRRTATTLSSGTYLTIHRYYSAHEAWQHLAIPRSVPTHVVEIPFPVGSVLVGPAYIETLERVNVMGSPHVHRFGGGVELVTVGETPIDPGAYRVDRLR